MEALNLESRMKPGPHFLAPAHPMPPASASPRSVLPKGTEEKEPKPSRTKQTAKAAAKAKAKVDHPDPKPKGKGKSKPKTKE